VIRLVHAKRASTGGFSETRPAGARACSPTSPRTCPRVPFRVTGPRASHPHAPPGLHASACGAPTNPSHPTTTCVAPRAPKHVS